MSKSGFCFYFCYYNLKGNRIDFKKEKIIFYIRVFKCNIRGKLQNPIFDHILIRFQKEI